jgi:hypothetical protein
VESSGTWVAYDTRSMTFDDCLDRPPAEPLDDGGVDVRDDVLAVKDEWRGRTTRIV